VGGPGLRLKDEVQGLVGAVRSEKAGAI
jgi:hypothetical protein